MKGGEVKVDKIEELLEYNKKILQELADCRKEIAELKKKNMQLEEKVRQLTLEKAAISENYQALRKKVYGRSSEKSSYVDYANHPFQLSLFRRCRRHRYECTCTLLPFQRKGSGRI